MGREMGGVASRRSPGYHQIPFGIFSCLLYLRRNFRRRNVEKSVSFFTLFTVYFIRNHRATNLFGHLQL